MILPEMSKRSCIYFIYDRDGIVDNYIIYQLKDLRKNVSFLHCVINGKLTSESEKSLKAIADEVYVRENKGNDIGAYKAAIDHIGWKKLSAYDELILTNFTCFGPIYPYKEAFDWAKSRDIDLWGLTLDTKTDWLGSKNYLHYNVSKYHIQSYFLVFRKPLLEGNFLSDFFGEIPENTNYVNSGCTYEYAFPGYFEERGYKWDVYCHDTKDCNYPLLHNPLHLVRDFRMPLIKKRSFTHHYTDVLNNTAGEATVRLIRFLQEETDYDLNLIWESILRTNSLSDIVRCVQLNRVLPREMTVNKGHESLKTGLIYYASHEDLFDEDISYIRNFPSDTEILITTDMESRRLILDEKVKAAGINAEVKAIGCRGCSVSSLLVAASDKIFDYDLVCFAHDRGSAGPHPDSIERSWAYKINENMFATKEYVSNVIDLFKKEDRLGIAFPSYPNHGAYANTIGNGWNGNYENTRKLLKEFGVRAKINEHTLCVAPIGGCFWFRPSALKKLFSGNKGEGWSYKDFPREPIRSNETICQAIERTYAYFAQDAGYYPVYLYNNKYAEIEFTNLEFNKTGSADMRYWVEKLAMDAIGYNKVEDTFGEGIKGTGLSSNKMYEDQNVNYGIKRSLVHLAYAIGCKYPKFWGILLPLRRMTQKILHIKTR